MYNIKYLEELDNNESHYTIFFYYTSTIKIMIFLKKD